MQIRKTKIYFYINLTKKQMEKCILQNPNPETFCIYSTTSIWVN